MLKGIYDNNYYYTEYYARSLNDEYPLLYAARIGDLNAVETLISEGEDVNEVDFFGTTALHLAAMYGNDEVVQYLLSKGADINAETYQESNWLFSTAYTPLDLAVKYSPTASTITLLIDNGATSNDWVEIKGILTEDMMKSAFLMNTDDFNLALAKIEAVAGNENIIWYEFENAPWSILLTELATGFMEPTYFNKLINTIEVLNAADANQVAAHYIIAKNLLMAFPSANFYEFNAGGEGEIIEASGFYSTCSVDLAARLTQSYCEQLSSTNNSLTLNNYTAAQLSVIKQNCFNSLSEILAIAADANHKAALHQTSEQLYQRYMDGETLLIPSGWSGHALNIILDKDLNLLIVVNAGESFHSLAPGVNAYNLQMPLAVTDIFSILTNQDQMDLEFKHFYDLGLTVNKDYSFKTDAQIYGNCTWNNLILSEKALLFVELRKEGLSKDDAKILSNIWYNELNDFEQTTILEEYLAKPSMETETLADILVNYHNELKTPGEIERAQLLVDVLLDSSHKKEFDSYYKIHKYDFSSELNQFLKINGYKIKDPNKYSESFADTVDMVLHEPSTLKKIFNKNPVLGLKDVFHDGDIVDGIISPTPAPVIEKLPVFVSSIIYACPTKLFDELVPTAE